MAQGKARIIDRGWMRIKSDIQTLKGRGVKVGLLAGGPSSEEGTPVVEYAFYNEFGARRPIDGGKIIEIPSRPFMRLTADNAERPAKTFAQNLVHSIIQNRMNADGALDALGLWYQSRIRNTIRTSPSWAVPNSPITVRRKGSSHPLIDDAIMIGAVNYEKTRL